jgi:glucuronokinase
MGNPSDGYFGKTISCAITNFCAEVTLWESPTLRILPNPVHDPTEFSSLKVLDEVATRDGYYGGLRLILASSKKFNEYCHHHNIEPEAKNFTISYETNIPRQVGLGGSSAIITAVIKALMQFYGLTDADIPKPIQPNLIRSVETEELEINAGLQDRVIQVYGGTVFMDFSKELMEKQGHGNYEYLDSSLMPPLFLAYVNEPSDSGKIHSDVKYRYQQNDPEVVSAMRTFGEYASECKAALERRDFDRVGELMNKNFDLRRKIFGDRVIGEKNLEMIQIARELGFPAKFSGSGGAIVGIYRTWEELRQLAQVYREHGFEFVKVAIDPGY